jgi:thioredoxin 2
MAQQDEKAQGYVTAACAQCGKQNRIPAAGMGAVRCGNCHEPLPWIAEAIDDTFADVVEYASLPVLVDLCASWCGPCRQVSPALEQVAREMAGLVKLVRVDVVRAPKTQTRFGAQAVPTLLLMQGGQVIDRRTGAASGPALHLWVQRALSRR